MANDSYQTIDSYLNSFEGPVREHLKKLRMLIRKAAPDAEELLNYNIPAFALVKGGKREEQIMMAGYKKYVGLYPHPTVMEHFWDRLEGYKKAKGSVQFPIDQPLPEVLIVGNGEIQEKAAFWLYGVGLGTLTQLSQSTPQFAVFSQRMWMNRHLALTHEIIIHHIHADYLNNNDGAAGSNNSDYETRIMAQPACEGCSRVQGIFYISWF